MTNAQWVRDSKKLVKKGAGNEKVEKAEEGQVVKGKGQKTKTTKMVGKRGMMGLREIQKYQKSTDLLI